MSEGSVNVIAPPYCGTPRLFHQFPVEVVVAAVVTTAVDVVEVGVIAVVVEVVGVFVVVGAVVVVEEQDANTSDVTMRQVSAIQIAPFFM